MRLLRRRHDHDRGDLRRGGARGPAAHAEGQSLPLHRLSQHRRCAARRRQCRGGRRRRRLRREPAQSVRRGDRHRPRALHARRAGGGRAASEGAALAASACAHQIHQARQGAWPCPASSPSSPGRTCRASSTPRRRTRITSSIPTTPTCSTTSSASSASASRPSWPRPRAPRKKPAALLEVDYELLPPVFDPEAAMEPGAPILHEKSVAFRDNIYVDIHGELGSVEQGFAEADVIHEMTYSTSRVQHVHLETHGSLAWRGDDGRLHVRTSSQAPFIAKQKLCYLFGLFDRDVHVFTERVGGGFGGKQEMISEDLCALATLKTGRPVMWEFTRAGAVHRRHDAPSDDHACEARRQEGRHADRHPGARRLQHRRLWRSRRRDAGSRARQPDRRLSLRQQEGRRLRRLHQHGAGRRISRLRRVADHLRHRMRHGRSREAARHEPVRDPAHQHGPRDRPDRVDLEGPVRRRCSAATGSTNVSISSRRRSRAAGDCPSPRATTGWRGPASRSPCWNRARRPSTAPAPRCGSWPTAAIISRSARPRWATARSRRTVRSPRRCSARAPSNIAIINGDTDETPYDTGTFASTGTVVAGQAVEKTATALRDKILDYRQPPFRLRCRPNAGCRTTPSSAPTARFRSPSSMRMGPRWAIASM